MWSRTCPPFTTLDNGAPFRTWLRTIVCRRTVDYWRATDTRTQGTGGSGATVALEQIADPDSDLNRQWDEEHDQYVIHCLLDLVEQKFEPVSLQAFRRLTLDGATRRGGGAGAGAIRRSRLRGEVAHPRASARRQKD